MWVQIPPPLLTSEIVLDIPCSLGFHFLVKTGGRISTFGDASITAEGKRYLGAQDRV